MIKKKSFLIKNSNKDFFFLLSLYFFDKKVFFSFYHLKLKNKLNLVFFNLIYLPFLLYKDLFILNFKGIFLKDALEVKHLNNIIKTNVIAKEKNFSKYLQKFRTYFLNLVFVEKQLLYNKYQWRHFFKIRKEFKRWRRLRRYFRRKKLKKFLKRYNRQTLNKFSLNWRKLILFKNNGKRYGRKFKGNYKSKKKNKVSNFKLKLSDKKNVVNTNTNLIKYRKLKRLNRLDFSSIVYSHILQKVSKYFSKKKKSIAKRRDFIFYSKNEVLAWLRFNAFRNLHFKHANLTRKKKKLGTASKAFLQNYFLRNEVLYSLTETKKRLYFYDSYTEQNKLTLFTSNIFLIWKKQIMHSNFRLRFVDYIFFSFMELNPNKGTFNKIIYIFTFFKYFFLVRKYLLVQKLVLKKKSLCSFNWKRSSILKNKNKFKLKVNDGYLSLLKYLNNFLNLTYLKLDLSKKFFVNKSFVYLSYILNVTFVNKRISVLSFNHFFFQRYWNSYRYSWLINDSVLKFRDILDMASNKNKYLNYVSNLKNLAKKKVSDSYLFVKELDITWDEKAVFFFADKFLNANATIIYKLKRNYYFFIYNLLTFYIFLNTNFDFLTIILKCLQSTNLKVTSLERQHLPKVSVFKHLFSNFNLFFMKNFFSRFIKILVYISYVSKSILIKSHLKIRKKYINLEKKQYLYNLLVSFILNLFLIFFRYFFLKGFLFKKKFINSTKYYNFIDNFMYDSFFSDFFLRKKKLFSGKFNNKVELLYTKFFINPTDNYYSRYHRWNKNNEKKALLHLIERNSNIFLVLSLFKSRRVLGHCSGGQAFDRDYVNTKRRKKGTRALTTIINLKFYKKAREKNLKNLFILSDNLYDFRLNHLSKHWVRKFKLGIPYLRGVKTLLRIPHHKGLKLFKRKRK